MAGPETLKHTSYPGPSMIILEQLLLPASPALMPEGKQSLSLKVERGETLWVTGPAESGKTTLLDHIALRRRSLGGAMTIMNYDAGPRIRKRTCRLLQQRISYVDAVPTFMERLTLADNIALPLELNHFHKTDIQRETESILRWFGLGAHAQSYPATLSQTVRLKAACARALVTQPSIILVDEPALTLCPDLRDQLLTTIQSLVKNGAAALLATRVPPPPDTPLAGRVITLPWQPDPPSGDDMPSFHAGSPLSPPTPEDRGFFS